MIWNIKELTLCLLAICWKYAFVQL